MLKQTAPYFQFILYRMQQEYLTIKALDIWDGYLLKWLIEKQKNNFLQKQGESVLFEDGYYCQFGGVLETFSGVSEKQHQ